MFSFTWWRERTRLGNLNRSYEMSYFVVGIGKKRACNGAIFFFPLGFFSFFSYVSLQVVDNWEAFVFIYASNCKSWPCNTGSQQLDVGPWSERLRLLDIILHTDDIPIHLFQRFTSNPLWLSIVFINIDPLFFSFGFFGGLPSWVVRLLNSIEDSQPIMYETNL